MKKLILFLFLIMILFPIVESEKPTSLRLIRQTFENKEYNIINSSNNTINLTLYILNDWNKNEYNYIFVTTLNNEAYFDYQSFIKNTSYVIENFNDNFKIKEFDKAEQGLYVMKFFVKPVARNGEYNFKLTSRIENSTIILESNFNVISENKEDLEFLDYIQKYQYLFISGSILFMGLILVFVELIIHSRK